ncbi:MAG: IPT/TIG domain-containing protein [Deltaproteobacteria bacterium]|nr:IPT/TIG domain-containing protein [Deltaproteobacteria bacterium]
MARLDGRQRAALLALVAFLLGCQDFTLARPEGPVAPVISSIDPPTFFAGQTLTLRGQHLDGDAGEAPQVLVEGVAARLLSAVTLSANGEHQLLLVQAPGELPFNKDLTWIVKTRAGDSGPLAQGRYLGVGHLQEKGELRRSIVNISPYGLAAGPDVLMALEFEASRIVVVDPKQGTVLQNLALLVPNERNDAAAARVSATLEDLAISADGERALVSYLVPMPAEVSNWKAQVAGLVALARCDGRWTPVRHLQLPESAGRVLRLIAAPDSSAFYGVLSLGAGGIVRLGEESLKRSCPEASEAGRQGVPDPDPSWPITFAEETLAEDELIVEPGVALSAGERLLAVSRLFAGGSTLDLYDLNAAPELCDGKPLCKARQIVYRGDSERWLLDVAFAGEHIAALDEEGYVLLAPNDQGAPAAVVDVTPGSRALFSTAEGRLLVAGPNRDLYVIDLQLDQSPLQARAIGTIVTPSMVGRVVQSDRRSVSYASCFGTGEESGSLIQFDRDAQTVTAEFHVVYSLGAVAYSQGLDVISAAPEADAQILVGAQPGSSYVGFEPPGQPNFLSVDAVAASRSFGAMAGWLSRPGPLEYEFVRLTRVDPDDPTSEQTVSVVRSGTEDLFLALAPWGNGVVGLKTQMLELVGTHPGCESPGVDVPLPASCRVPLPSGLSAPAGARAFAVAEGAGLVLVPQSTREDGFTTAAAVVGIGGGLAGTIRLPDAWETTGLSASRDGRTIAIAARPLCESDTDTRCQGAGTGHLVLDGDYASPMPFSGYAGWIGAVAVSPDGSVIYLGASNGTLVAVAAHRAPFNGPDDYRLVATLGTDEDLVSALNTSPDGSSLSATLAFPNSAVLLLK